MGVEHGGVERTVIRLRVPIGIDRAGGRVRAIGKHFPGNHAFTDMYATVVYNTTSEYLIAIGFIDFSNAPAKEVVAQVPQVQGFVGVG